MTTITAAITIDAEGVQITDDVKNVFLPWQVVQEIRAYYTTGTLHIAFKGESDWWYQASEQYIGFDTLQSITEHLRGARWYLSAMRSLADGDRDLVIYERGKKS